MSFRLRLKYYLVHTLNYAGKKADELISSERLAINGERIATNEIIRDNDTVTLDGNIIKTKPHYEYYALNKPIGIESTFDPNVVDNLSKVFPFDSSFFVAGRLDKASEGLLLISNDGKWVNDITRPESKKEKEYEVEVDSEIDEIFLKTMAGGVDIGFYLTQPCKIWKTGTKKFTIILTEGKNKQIRRMCKALKRKVVSLKRTRIDSFYLPELEGNMYRKLDLA